jgi:hypothetical protein
MALPISNFVMLAPGIEVRLHFVDHRITPRMVRDPIRDVMVSRESLVMYVDEVNGQPVDKMYSILSQKHAAEFAGYLTNKSYLQYNFVVIKDSAGTVPPRIVSVTPR